MIFAPPVVGAKERVASLNLCSDLLLLQYLPHGQIAGLTRQASDPTMSPLADMAVLLPNLTTTPEHLVKAQADILLMTQGHAPRIIGKEINKITLGYPGTLQYWPDSLALLRDAGLPIEASEIAKARGMINKIAGIFTDKPRVLVLAPRWFGLGSDHLAMQWLTMAGAQPWREIDGWSMKLNPEALIMDPPDMIILESHGPHPSLATKLLDERLTRKLAQLGTKFVASSPKYWTCPGPWSIPWLQQIQTTWATQ